MASVATRIPGAAANIAGAGEDWSTPTVASFGDSSDATTGCTVSLASPSTTDYMKLTGFDWTAVDPGCTVDGLIATIRAVDSGGDPGNLTFADVSLVKADSVVGSTDQSASEAITAAVQAFTFGGAADKWGSTIAYADLISTFGIAFKVTNTNSDATPAIVQATLTLHFTHSVTPALRGAARMMMGVG